MHLSRLSIILSASLLALFFFSHPSQAESNATVIVGGTSYGSAVQISPATEYQGSVSAAHDKDFFFFDVSAGQVATFVYSSSVTFGSAGFQVYDQAHLSALSNDFINGAEQTKQVILVGNNTTPTRYYFVVDASSGSNDYLFSFTVRNQNDAGVAGDAADSNANHRLITPNLASPTLFTGELGSADKEDWYRIQTTPGQMISVTFKVLEYGADVRLYYTVFDQTGSSSLVSNAIDKPSLDPVLYRHTANSSTPSAYVLKLRSNGAINAPLQYQVEIVVVNQSDGNLEGDAGDNAISAKVLTPALGSKAGYTGQMSASDKVDWYRINAVSGMAISVTVAVLDYGADIRLYHELFDQTGSSKLFGGATDKPSNETTLYRHMASNSTPTTYLLQFRNSNGTGAPLQYTFTVETVQQSDATQAGDAGDSFDTARAITPTLEAGNNLLGSADKEDYYLIDLPIDPNNPDTLVVPFKMIISPVPWPQGASGALSFQVYNPNRSVRGSLVRIQAPLTDPAVVDLSGCDLCYVKVIDNSSGTQQLQYTFSLLAPNQVFLPVVVR